MEGKYAIITEEITSTIIRSFYIAIDNRDLNVFSSLNSFLYRRLSDYYNQDNIGGYVDFSAVFVYYYEYSLKKLNLSITYRDVYEACADRSTRGLKEKINSYSKWGRGEITNLHEQNKINKYSKIILNRFSEIIYISLRYKDISHLSFTLSQLHQVPNAYDHNLSNLRLEILISKRKKLTAEELQDLHEKKELYEINSYVNNVVRILYKVTLFWSIFLYQTDAINFDDLSQILEMLESYKGYIQHDFLEDVMILRDEQLGGDYSWHHWDFMARPEGIVYSPPSVNSWVTFGMLIYLLKTNLNISFGLENNNSESINSFDFLLSSIRDMLKSLSENGYTKWRPILKISKKEFSNRIKLLQERIEQLNNLSITNKESLVASLPLDESIVANFKRAMLGGWKDSNSLLDVFIHFKKIVKSPYTSPEEDFSLIGFRGQLWQGYKPHLINHPEFTAPVFGIENIGIDLSLNEESFLISQIIQNKSFSIANDLVQELDKSINSIKEKGYNPSVIFIGLDLWHKVFNHFSSSDYRMDWNQQDTFPFKNFGGEYKGLPIIRFRSEVMNNISLVADFDKSFHLNQRLVEDSDDETVNLEIREITQEAVQTMLDANPNFWMPRMSREQAITKIQNAVILDFYLLEKIIIDDINAYSIIYYGS